MNFPSLLGRILAQKTFAPIVSRPKKAAQMKADIIFIQVLSMGKFN